MAQRRVGIVGFPIDLGGNMRGVDMGPSAIRLAGLVHDLQRMGCDVHDLGNVLVHTRALIEEVDEKAHYIDEIVRACQECARMVRQARADGIFPIVLGGDHSVAIGSLWGLAADTGPGGLLWIDAHADVNTPDTTLSGNVHGMSLAVALGRTGNDDRLVPPPWPRQAVLAERTVLIGTRDVDPLEREYLRAHSFPTVFTMADIDKRGISSVLEEALSIAGRDNFLHVSLDMDAIDPVDAPGVGTPVRGGLSYREAHTLMETLADSAVTSLDVVEVNPVLDHENRTARLASELVCSLLGERIL